MARAYVRKVNHHVTYFTAAGKPKPAIITAVGAGTAVTLRVRHTGQVATVNRGSIGAGARASVWSPA